MHHDRNHGTWSELKARRPDKFDQPKFDDTPLNSLNIKRSNSDDEALEIQKVKKDRAAKQLSRVKAMFKDMVEHSDEQSNKLKLSVIKQR